MKNKIFKACLGILTCLTLASCQSQDVITVGDDGYLYVNGQKTDHKVDNGQKPVVSVGEDGYLYVNGEKTQHKVSDDAKPTVSVGEDGYLYVNGEKTNYKVDDGKPDGEIEKPTNPEKTVDLAIFMGQSNMAGRGVASEAPTVPEGHGFEYRAITDPNTLHPFSEPFGVEENKTGGIRDISGSGANNKTGDMVASFVNSYYEVTNTPLVCVSASVGGTAISQWQPNTSLYNDAMERYESAKNYLTSNGYTINHDFMVWCQGESDSSHTPESYINGLSNLVNGVTDKGIDKCFIIRIGDSLTKPGKNKNICLAQNEFCMDSPKCAMASCMLYWCSQQGMMKDYAHFKQEAYNITGDDAGKNTGLYFKTGMEQHMMDVLSEGGVYCPLHNLFAGDSLKLSHSSYQFNLRQENQQLKLIATTNKGNDEGVEWSSENEGVAKVNNGLVTPVAVGTTNIIAKYKNIEKKCAITVIDEEIPNVEALPYGNSATTIANPGVWHYYAQGVAKNNEAPVLDRSKNEITYDIKSIGVSGDNFAYVRYQPNESGNYSVNINIELTSADSGEIDISGGTSTTATKKFLETGPNTITYNFTTSTSRAFQIKFRSAGIFKIVATFEKL